MLGCNKCELLEWTHLTDLTAWMISIRIMYFQIKNGRTLLNFIWVSLYSFLNTEVQFNVIQVGPAHVVSSFTLGWCLDLLRIRISIFRSLKRSELFKYKSIVLLTSVDHLYVTYGLFPISSSFRLHHLNSLFK